MNTKRDAQYSFNHTQARMKERYNISIDMNDYTNICKRISKKKYVKFISEEKQKNNIQQIYDVVFKGNTVRVVWDRNNKYIRTVLPIKEN
jgi:hypothetical protein